MPIHRSGPPPDDLIPLLQGASAGDEDAWRSLVERYWRRVYALARSRCSRSDIAEEVTQSVFVTVAIKLRDEGGDDESAGYQERGRFEAWLFRIAMNRLRDEMRRRNRQANTADPASLDAVLVTASDGNKDELDEELSALRIAMAGLTDQDREIIELRHHADMSFKDIAQVTGEPIGTLLARHHRALKKLRTRMEQSGFAQPAGDAREMDE